jgi:predicted metal-binding membrane protein
MASMAIGGIGGIVLFLSGWTAMMVAMMVPATLPLILLYSTLARKRLNSARAQVGMAVMLVGYVAVWATAGLPVYAYSSLSSAAGSLAAVLPALLLIVGGAYQFTPLNRICHARCSTPLSLVWMLTAAVIIFAEKTAPGSHRVAGPLGILMVAGGVVLLATALLGGMAPGMESM